MARGDHIRGFFAIGCIALATIMLHAGAFLSSLLVTIAMMIGVNFKRWND